MRGISSGEIPIPVSVTESFITVFYSNRHRTFRGIFYRIGQKLLYDKGQPFFRPLLPGQRSLIDEADPSP